MRRVGAALYIVAVVVFVLAALGVDVPRVTDLELVAAGLAAFAAAHVVP